MRKVYLASNKSKDPRTKIGAVLVRDKNSIIDGFNGFPRGVQDLEERYNDRLTKYQFITHAESNTVLSCARLGVCTLGSVLYTQGLVCAECCKVIIQGGISEIVTHKQWPNLFYSKDWTESINLSKIMLSECNIHVREFDKVLGLKGFLDGKEIEI